MTAKNEETSPSRSGPERSPIACVLLPEFPIVAHHPEEADESVGLAVHVGRATAARIRWCDAHAHRHGIRPGQTLAAASARCATLRSRRLEPERLAEAQRNAVASLLRWTPRVTSDREDRFFCEPVGGSWAHRVIEGLGSAWGPVAVGVGPWAAAAYAAALGHRERFLDAPLHVLDLDVDTERALASLGVRTVGALRRLEPVDLGVRFGPGVAEAWRRAGGDDPRLPNTPRLGERPSVDVRFDEVELDRLEALLFVLRPALERLLRAPVGRGDGVTRLDLTLHRERAAPIAVTVRSAHPIGDPRTLLELVRTRLENRTRADDDSLASDGSLIVGFTLDAVALAPLTGRNAELFDTQHRDPAAAHIALARLASRFGADRIRRATKTEQASFVNRAAWVDHDPTPGPSTPLRRLDPPSPLRGRWIHLAGRRRRVLRFGRVERALAPWWPSGVIHVERLAWAEVEGPLLVVLRANRSKWEAIAWMD